MKTITTGRVLLVAVLAIGLIVTVPAVSAHGGEPTAQPPTEQPGADADSAAWADWMESHMTEYMGPGAVEWMESHMGLSVDEMGREMAGSGHFHDDHSDSHTDIHNEDHTDGHTDAHNMGDAYGHC